MANIILLEPDRLLAETYGKTLMNKGHKIVPCASAQAAIMAADVMRPDLVILELQLIEHSGIEFLYEFRSYTDWQNIPVIAHTHIPAVEFAGNWDMLRQELGLSMYLYKPHTSLHQLLSAVDDQLSVPV